MSRLTSTSETAGTCSGVLAFPTKPVTLGVPFTRCQVPSGHLHVDQDVAGEELALRGLLLPLHHLLHHLHRDEDLAEGVIQRLLPDALLERLLHLVLEARVGVDDVPLLRHERLRLHRVRPGSTGGAERAAPRRRGSLAGAAGTRRSVDLELSQLQTRSKTPRMTAATAEATITATVAARVSRALGQVTRRSSSATSRDTCCVFGIRQTTTAATAGQGEAHHRGDGPVAEHLAVVDAARRRTRARAPARGRSRARPPRGRRRSRR